MAMAYNTYMATPLPRLPTHDELSKWGEAAFLSFLRLCQCFIVPDGKKGERWEITSFRREAAETAGAVDTHISEMLGRVALPLSDELASDRKFYYRFVALTRLVLRYLRANPERVTSAMRTVIEPSMRLSWCLTERTEIIAAPQLARPATVDEMLAAAHEKIASVCYALANSISQEDIGKLPPKEKLLALSRLQYIFDAQHRQKPTRGVFKHLVIAKASRDELEATMFYQGE